MVSTVSAASSSPIQQSATLNELMTKYKHQVSGGAAVGALSSLGRQITDVAKAAGQHVILPTAPPPPGGIAPMNPESQNGKIDLTV